MNNEYLKEEILKLTLENIALKEQLECKEIINVWDFEDAYKNYYGKENEVLK